LVRFDDTWSYHKGTNAPQAGWMTIDDEDLDATWATGPGGFGFGDNDDNTVLNDMLNGYTTVYTRRSFSLTAGFDTNRHLHLVMDWDDGFIAWLDGVELARSPNIAGSGEPPYTATTIAGQNHEASAGGGPPPTVYDLGAVGNRLSPGTHVLAVLGLNAATNSTDFSLIADLILAGGGGGTVQDGYFALVKTNSVVLSGSNTFPNSTRVTVNGVNANFNPADGTWSRAHLLEPNMNHLFIAALDAQGHILASTNKDVVSELSSVSIGGDILGDVGINASNFTVRVTSNVIIRPGSRWSIGENSVLLMSPNTSIRVETNGELRTFASPHRAIFFLPADGITSWQEISAIGVNAQLNLRGVEIVTGRVRAQNGATVLLEDSVMRDQMSLPGVEFLAAVNAASVTLRRTHVYRFAELDSRDSPFLAEDCLMERMFVDAFDIKSTNAPLVVRRTTMRYGAVPSGEVDVDGVDLGPGNGPVVENCLIHDFDDKGVSIGTGAHGTVVRNSLIYNCGLAGVSAYASSNCIVSQNTISMCSTGLFLRNNPGPGLITGTNNIIWGNGVQIGIHGTSSASLSYSDVQGGAPGAGNINSDPLFVNPAAADFRLAGGSPAIGTGFGGVNMGTTFPVGGIPPSPFNLAAIVDGTNQIQLEWLEDADNENGFVIERSDDGVGWYYLGAALPNSTSYIDTEAAVGQRYFYRVRAENSSGISRWSNIASGVREVPTTYVGGRLGQNTIWSPALGNIIVMSNLIVPTNISLTMLPGTTVFVTNGVSIVAGAGGTIQVNGDVNNRVRILPRGAGTIWRELSAQGPGASITMRYAEVAGGQTTVYSNAVGLFEDSYYHDYRISGTTLTQPIMLSSFAGQMTVRRCHFREYYETLFRDGVITVEDCLFEYMSGDALDFDGAQPGTVLRRSTFRHGTRAPSNIDAVDVGPGQLGPCRNVIIENCLMFDFPTDKGVSIGDAPQQATGTVVRNCLIYGCLSGVQVKDSCFAEVYNCTIVSNRWGLTNYNKGNPSAPTGGGHTTNAHNNIVWDNGVTISMWNGGTLTADHCNFGNTNWPGVGNINVDPQFVNAALRDYRLAPTSPCRGAGRDGADMGAQFPVGSRMAPSHPGFESIQVAGTEVVLRFWADNEKTYTIETTTSLSTASWSQVSSIPAPVAPRLTEVRIPLSGSASFYRITALPAP
jgi:parallel beta-helix repeat protein